MASAILSIHENKVFYLLFFPVFTKVNKEMARNDLFQNDEKLPNFSLDFSWLSNASQESTNATSRFPTMSEEELEKVVSERHSKRTKQTTNCSLSTFKGIN